MQQKYIAIAVLVNKEDKILIGKRSTQSFMAGFWEFPGGKIEKGESPEAALTRELHEELSIKVAAKDLTPLSFCSHQYDTNTPLTLLCYTTRQWKGSPQALIHDTLKWVSIDFIARYPFLEGSKSFFLPLRRFLN